jgi:hypothetical protein
MGTAVSKTANKVGNAFTGKAKRPTAKEVSAALGPSQSLWKRLLAELADELDLKGEWGMSSPKLGWSLRMKRDDRIIVYLAPLQGRFQASFALGDKAVQTALASGLPNSVVTAIHSATKYAEGKAVRFDVRSVEDLVAVKKIASAKLSH